MKYNKFWEKYKKNIVYHGNKLNIIESCIDRHASQYPDKEAFIFDINGKIKIYTYKQLEEEVNKFANYLNSLKIKPNSHIFIFLPKIPELFTSLLASIKSGNIAAPLFEAFQTDGLELRLKRGDASVLITNKELSARINKKIKQELPNLKIIIIDNNETKNSINSQDDKFKPILKNETDTALLMFTSSTAGTPVAGIEIPHQALIQQHFTAELVLNLDKNDNYWCTAHPGWVTGTVYGIIAPLSIGCTNFILTEHFNAKNWLSFLVKNKISVLYTAPTALRMLKPEVKKSDLKNLKNLCSVGEALTSDIYDFYKKLGIKINDTYWQTETGSIVIANLPSMRKAGSIGKAIPGITAEIIDSTISLKPDFPSLMTGIYKHEDLYKSYFKNNWFTTNDLAKKDKQGFFFFISRKDDIIKVSGERISPIEVESELMKHKAVKEAAVIGIPHEVKGNILKAFVVLNEKFKIQIQNKEDEEKLKQELILFVKKNYAGHSYPKIIEFVKDLPKTNSGKIIRSKLRETEKR